ncbi:SCY1-like protein 2, partial [Phenoliferia sp. Uapishka_3]
MAEPMEETRSSITFATEPVTASLRHAITASSSSHRRNKQETELELDEVEIQKGLSQIGKGLQFLHESAKLVHGNLTPDSIIINAKGDWKLSGFGLSSYLFDSSGVPAQWTYPSLDSSLPPSCQLDYDYLAPEYLLDESAPSPSNDLYSLGCILHSIHTKTGPPFSNRSSLNNARTNIEQGLQSGLLVSQWRKLPEEAQSVLSQLITRYPSSRLSATSFLSHHYFSSLLVSTLRFLERDSFASQNSEAQASFLKGLIGVLPRFKVMPLVYHALDSDNPVVLEKALRVVPGLSETLDYTTVKQILFPKITTVFTKTTMLSVKVKYAFLSCSPLQRTSD